LENLHKVHFVTVRSGRAGEMEGDGIWGGGKEKRMAVGGFGSFKGLGGMVSGRKPGHFVAFTEHGRIDATLNQSGKLSLLLEKRGAISVKDVQEASHDGSVLRGTAKTRLLDPNDIVLAMPAPDGELLVEQADHDAWIKWRIPYDVTLEAGPIRVHGKVLLTATEDPSSLTDRGAELFVAVFGPTVEVSGVTLRDSPRDSVLVSRSHIQRASTTARR
jgi:hypothetical protein